MAWNDYLPTKRSNTSPDISDFFDKLQKEFFGPDVFRGGEGDFVPKVEVKETDKKYKVCAEVPGMKKDDINITLRENRLIIEGEKKQESKKEDKDYFRSEFSYGSFYRAIPLNQEVDPDKVTASYKDGILEVSIEKTGEDKQKAKRIEIKQ